MGGFGESPWVADRRTKLRRSLTDYRSGLAGLDDVMPGSESSQTEEKDVMN
jgi:hypothetical protein